MTEGERISWWQTFHKFQLSREKTWRPKIQTALKNQYKAVTDNLQQYGINNTIGNIDRLVEYTELAKVIKNIYIDAGTVFGGKAYQMVKKQAKRQTKQLMPIGYNEDLINEIIQHFNISLLSEAVLPISETTKDQVLKVLIDSQQNGVSINGIVKKLSNTDLTYQRSRTIARTETVSAANAGAVLSVKKLGHETEKIWISATDNRTRRIPRDEADHLHANGQTVPMDEPFKIRDKNGAGFVNMQHPGDKNGGVENCANCRCTTGFIII